jgi:nucleoside-diphosphate-sugar epimerase
MHRGIPLPLGSVSNRRSFVALANLVDLIHRCIEHPGAVNSVFLLRDPEDLSTTELLRRIARALGRRARLVPVPTPLLRAAARAVGMGTVAQRLLDSLQVDDAATRQRLSWTPPHSVDEELRRTAAWFLATAR